MNIILHGGNTKTIDTMNDRLADAMRNAAPNKKNCLLFMGYTR